jgi:calcineurin-like phosphoesterase family protein
MIFAYSDLHLHHKNIGFYCNRPKNFTDLIIRRHNEVVRDEDTVLNLGDVGFGPPEPIREAIKQMKGKHIVLKGNHDRSVKWLRDCGFETVLHEHQQKLTIKDPEYEVTVIVAARDADPRALVSEGVVISHEPYANIKWPYLYGHTHNNPVPWDYMDRPYPISVIPGRNISIELVNYMPVPIPFLINDEVWIKKNYLHWYKRLFNYEGKRKRQDVRRDI